LFSFGHRFSAARSATLAPAGRPNWWYRVAEQLLGAKYRAIQILDVAARVRTTATEITCAFRDRERRFGGERVTQPRFRDWTSPRRDPDSRAGVPSGRGARRLEQGE